MSTQKTWPEISGRPHRLVRRPAAAGTTTTAEPFRGRRVTRPPEDEAWATYAPKNATAPRLPLRVPANDNRQSRARGLIVRQANDGPTDAHRTAVSVAGHETRHSSPGTRIERALVKEGDPHAGTLRHAHELVRPAVLTTANDNEPDDGASFGKGIGHETYQRIRPSIGELLAAFADGMRPRIVTEKRRDGGMAPGRDRAVIQRFTGGMRAVDSFVEVGGRVGKRFVGLQFRNGQLVSFSDSAGRQKQPWVDATRDSRAAVEPNSATAEHIRDAERAAGRVLRLKATSAYESWEGHGGPAGLPAMPTKRAADARAVLATAYGRGPSVAVTRCGSGVAADYGLVAGVTEAKGIGEGRTSAPRHEALAEMDRKEAADDLRDRMGEKGVRVLDALLDADTFREVGQALGYAESSAHRHGRAATGKILDEIEKKLAA